MITLFEDITYELTDYEKNTLVSVVVKGLSSKKGKENAITNKVICEKLKSAGYKITEPRLRKIIHHIRVEQLIVGLCCNSKGYYVTDSLEELSRYVESLAQRIRSQQAIHNSMKKCMEKIELLNRTFDFDDKIKIDNVN
ncbi:MAG: hypothetical protein GOVbin5978_36 [Prokaryotic dsDNA virus sp.]|nr:MAG: hypothetical protein GOVbin5978_36 [Prokaryotic dsDNA virus sp.]|tara:strand:- start:464 stop:880 length:417 start_codon:yes stop_codon:yes gene_type:complete